MKTNSPNHEAIAQRARELWLSQHQPTGRDHEIWLEAERQLAAPTAASNAPSATNGRGNGNTQAGGSPADPKAADLKPKNDSGKSATQSKSNGEAGEVERLRGEMASESEVEFNISPAMSQDDEIKAALQKKDARAPKTATKGAPRVPPAETGKPVWPKPHSS
ncbi:MAG: DUF2934 domain-containing protein [Opitutaceae bacterium]